MQLTEDQQKVLAFVRKEKWTTPLKVGLFLGRGYYEASSVGSKTLMPLVYMGLVEKQGEARGVKYVFKHSEECPVRLGKDKCTCPKETK